MLRIQRYDAGQKPLWDQFVGRAKNGVFLFRRDYMDYHADRFADHSLLFFAEDRLIGLLPASAGDGVLTSHSGLTFGGIVTDERMRTPVMVELFGQVKRYLREQGIGRMVYKPVPHIYHRFPAEEDLYALFIHGGRLVRRNIASVLRPGDHPEPTKGRRWSTRKARNNGLDVGESRDFTAFMALEEAHLASKYGARPTHTAAEMELLAGRFPDNILLFTATKDGELLGGVVVYVSRQVAHTQHIASTEHGRELGALDRIFEVLLDEVFADRPYFDFGTSNEDGGRRLNVGLIDNKESYGARAVAYDWYELDTRD
jgi:hypothetical protein